MSLKLKCDKANLRQDIWFDQNISIIFPYGCHWQLVNKSHCTLNWGIHAFHKRTIKSENISSRLTTDIFSDEFSLNFRKSIGCQSNKILRYDEKRINVSHDYNKNLFRIYLEGEDTRCSNFFGRHANIFYLCYCPSN